MQDTESAAGAETPDPVLDYALEQGFGNMHERLASGDTLNERAHKLLALLLAGIAGAMALGRGVLDPGPVLPSAWGAAAVALWWAVVAVVLARRCINTRYTWTVHNEPLNLYRPESGWGVRQLLRADLHWLQQRIDATRERNTDVAQWFDRCLLAALGGLPVFALAVAVSRWAA